MQRLTALALASVLALSLSAPVAANAPAKYDSVSPFYSNHYYGYAVAMKDGKYAAIDSNGYEMVPLGTYAYMNGYSGGVCVVGTGAAHKTSDGVMLPAGKFGALNDAGGDTLFLPTEYDYIWPCDGVTLPLLKDGKVALARPDGTLAVPFREIKLEVVGGTYRRPVPADFGLSRLPDPDLSAYPELEVTWLPGYHLSQGASSGGLLRAMDIRTGKYGLLDVAGTPKTSFVYERIEGYTADSDWAEVQGKDNNTLFYFDAQGARQETPYNLGQSHNTLLHSMQDKTTKKFGAVDTEGTLVIDCVYERELVFEERGGGYALAIKGDVAGVVDTKGNFSVPEGCEGVWDVLDGGRLLVVSRNNWTETALIERATGKAVVPFGRYSSIQRVSELYQSSDDFSRLIVYDKATSRCGIIDLAGNVVIPVQYGSIYQWDADYVFSGTCYLVTDPKTNHWGILDSAGKELLPCKYYIDVMAHMGPAAPSLYDVLKELYPDAPPHQGPKRYFEGLATFQANGKTGFVDETGAAVVPALFDEADVFCRGWSVVQKDGLYGLLKHPIRRDTVSEAYAADVKKAEEQGLVTGSVKHNQTYPISRGQLAELVINLLEKRTGKTVEPSSEGSISDTASLPVRKVVTAGLMSGTNGVFSPDVLVSREMLAVVLYRTYECIYGSRQEGPLITEKTDLSAFSDGGAVSVWATGPVSALSRMGIVTGTTFSPKAYVAVEEAITLCLRVYEK